MRPRTDRQPGYLLALGFFSLASLYLAWPWLSGQVTIPWDAKAHFQPQLTFLAHALHSGQSPFWTPNVFAGMPQIADPQSLIFSPPFFLLAALDPDPSFQAADAVVFLMLTFGGVGLMLYFRDQGWHAAGALVAALAFAYGGSAAWRIQHISEVLSLCWFGLSLFALARALDRRSIVWGALAGLFSGLMVLGRDQIAWFFVLTLTAYVLWRAWSGPDRLRRAAGMAAPLAAGLVVGLIVAGPVLLLTIELARQSNRSEITLQGALYGSLHPAALLTALSANLFSIHGPQSAYWGPPSTAWGVSDLYLARNMSEIYFGALPVMALLALGVGRGFICARSVRFFSFATLALAIYGFGKYTPVFAALFNVPGADLFRRPADATFPIGALCALLGGYCVHRAFYSPARKLALGVLIVCCGFAVALALAYAKDRLGVALAPLGFSAIFAALALALVAFAPKLSAHPARAVLLAGLLTTFDLSLNNAPNESTGLPPQTYDVLRTATQNDTIVFLKQALAARAAPDRRDRVELAGVDFQWPNAGLTHGFDHDLGYNPIRLKIFFDATHANDHVATPEQRVFSPAFASYRSAMANLIGLRLIATGVPVEEIDKSLRPGDLTLLARTRDAYIYENPNALPRVLLASRALAADFAALEANGDWPDVDFRKAVLIDSADCHANPSLDCASKPAALAQASAGSARLSNYANTQVDVDADVPAGGGFLVLNDVWQSWWNAAVDGAPAPILRANLMFRAVAVPPGRHSVRFSFSPLRGLTEVFSAAGGETDAMAKIYQEGGEKSPSSSLSRQ